MKYLFILFFSFSILHSAISQLNEHKVHVYGRYGVGTVQSTSYNIFSLNSELIVGNHVGLNYNFDYLIRKDSIRQFHTTMGLLGAPVLFGIGLSKIADSDTTTTGAFGILGGLLLLVLPDGISGHFSPAYKWDISPYANILGLDFIKDKKNDQFYLKYACSFGLKSTYILKDNFTVNAYLETRQAAKFGWAFGGGLGIGYLFGEREVKEK